MTNLYSSRHTLLYTMNKFHRTFKQNKTITGTTTTTTSTTLPVLGVQPDGNYGSTLFASIKINNEQLNCTNFSYVVLLLVKVLRMH